MTTVLSDIRGAGFNAMTVQRLHSLSAVHVTKSDTFDELMNPVPGGLYDARMGPTELDQGALIKTKIDGSLNDTLKKVRGFIRFQ